MAKSDKLKINFKSLLFHTANCCFAVSTFESLRLGIKLNSHYSSCDEYWVGCKKKILKNSASFFVSANNLKKLDWPK